MWKKAAEAYFRKYPPICLNDRNKATKPMISIILHPVKIQATHLPITYHKLYGLIQCHGNSYVILGISR
jgi:hypothetical protein